MELVENILTVVRLSFICGLNNRVNPIDLTSPCRKEKIQQSRNNTTTKYIRHSATWNLPNTNDC